MTALLLVTLERQVIQRPPRCFPFSTVIHVAFDTQSILACREKLATEFGVDMAQYAALVNVRCARCAPVMPLRVAIHTKFARLNHSDMKIIVWDVQDEVNRFLESMPPPAAPAPPVGSKRKAPDGAAPEASGSSPATAEGTVLQLSELKRVEVRLFKGNVQIDVR